MFNVPVMTPAPKSPHLRDAEKAARQVSAQFLEMLLKPMFAQHGSFGGESWLGDSATSENIIKPMMVQNIATSMANQGNAFGLYPIFLKAIQRIQERQTGPGASP